MTFVFKVIQKINRTISPHSLFLWVSENCINCLIYIAIRVHQLRGISGIMILVEHQISQKWSRLRGLTVNQLTFHFLLTFLFPLQKILDVKSQIMSTIHPIQTLQRSSPAGTAGRYAQSHLRGTSSSSTGWIDSHSSWWWMGNPSKVKVRFPSAPQKARNRTSNGCRGGSAVALLQAEQFEEFGQGGKNILIW